MNPSPQDDIDEITKALLALPKGKNKPLCWDMDVLVGFIHDREVPARIDENLMSQRVFDGMPSTPADAFSKRFVKLIEREKALHSLNGREGSK